MKCRSCWFFLSSFIFFPAPPKVTGYQGFSLNFQVGKTTAR
jgi:hypothetical protein